MSAGLPGALARPVFGMYIALINPQVASILMHKNQAEVKPIKDIG